MTPHEYSHLDGRVKLELTMKELATRVVELNYGTHQLLSCLIDELEFRHQTKAKANPQYNYELHSPLAEGIKELFTKNLRY